MHVICSEVSMMYYTTISRLGLCKEDGVKREGGPTLDETPERQNTGTSGRGNAKTLERRSARTSVPETPAKTRNSGRNEGTEKEPS